MKIQEESTPLKQGTEVADERMDQVTGGADITPNGRFSLELIDMGLPDGAVITQDPLGEFKPVPSIGGPDGPTE